MTSDIPYIVADIGGTNARFGLATHDSSSVNGYRIEQQHTFASNAFTNIAQATSHYLELINRPKIAGACLAVAGPVTGDQIKVTNLNWEFSRQAVERKLSLNKLIIINDFAAHAFAAPLVDKANLININLGKRIETAAIAVLGPGTGFGAAGLIPHDNSWIVLPAEGGHITLAAKNYQQAELIKILQSRFSHVSIETIFSGPGLANLYQALSTMEGAPFEALAAPQICQQALTDINSLGYRTLMLFCNWLGQAAGDLALALGANGGVYLSGGVLLKFTEFLLASDFIQGFTDKGQMSDIVSNIPVNLVTESNSALLGAAAYFQQSQ
jgi:glucokinase